MTDNKFNPAYDNKIALKYSKKTIENKIKNKQAFCEEAGLNFDKRVPLLCVTYTLTDDNNLGMLQDIMVGVLEQAVEIVLTGIGTEKYQKYFTDLADKYSTKVVIVGNSEDERRKIYAASDVILITAFNDECIDEAQRAMNYGVIPVIPATDFTEDYNPNQERGNAFVYIKDSPWSLFANIIRATESFRFPYDWKNIQIGAMENE